MDIRRKLEAADVDGYNWNWSDKYLDEFVEELIRAFTAAFVAEFPEAAVGVVQLKAADYAKKRGSEQIVNIGNATKERVRELVGRGLATGQPVRGENSIASSIKDDFIFGEARANLVARTETAYALGDAQMGAAQAQGRNEKRWITSGDIIIDGELCVKNEKAKWIAIGNAFPSGVSTIPQHPNCRCTVIYRTKELHEVEVGVDFRCPGCRRLLARNAYNGVRILCRHCKVERVA